MVQVEASVLKEYPIGGVKVTHKPGVRLDPAVTNRGCCSSSVLLGCDAMPRVVSDRRQI